MATVVKSEYEVKQASSLIEILKKQLLAANIVPELAPELALDTSPDAIANNLIMEAKLQAAEKAAAEWKLEKMKLQKVIGNLKSEIEEYKIQFEEKQLQSQPNAVAENNPAPAPATGSGWFKSLTTSNTVSTSASVAAPSVESLASIVSVKTVAAVPTTLPTVHVETPNDTPIDKPIEKPVATSSLKSWWSKSTTSQLPTAQPSTQTNPLSPVSPTPSQGIDAKYIALEQELAALKRELQVAKDSSAKTEDIPVLPEKQSQELEKLKQELIIQNDTLKNASDKNAELEKQLVIAKEQVEGTNTQLELLQSELNLKLKSLISGEDLVKSLEAKVTSLIQESATKESEVFKLENSLAKINAEKENLIAVTQNLQKDVEIQQKRLDENILAFNEQALKINELEIEKKILEASLNTFKGDNLSENPTSSPIESLHAEFQKQTSQLKIEASEVLKRNEAEINSFKVQLDSLQAEKGDLQSKYDRLQSRKIELESINKSLNVEIESLRSNTESSTGIISELESAKGTITALQQEIQKLMKSHEVVSNELQDQITKTTLLESQVAKMQELNNMSLQKGNEQFTKQILQLGQDLEKKSAEIVATGKKNDVAKQEIEILQKQIKQQKDNSEFLTKSLQDQINELLESKAASDKKIRLEMDEKFKAEKVQIEEKFKKEKAEVEEKGKKNVIDCELKNTKERAALEEGMKKEKTKFNQDLDKLRKEYDTLKTDSAKKDDLNKATTRIKTLETEIATVKSENQKTIDSLNIKISELNKELNASKEDSLKLVKVSRELVALQTKMEIVMQENEVAHSNYERNLKGVTDKDDLIKKLKSNREELVANDKLLKATISKLEKEKEATLLEITALKARIDSQVQIVEGAKKNAEGVTEKLSETLKVLEVQVADLKVENERLELKVEEANAELTSSTKKSAQMVHNTLTLDKRFTKTAG